MEEKREKVDVATCEFCGKRTMGYAHIEGGRVFCTLPSECSAEYWQTFEDARKRWQKLRGVTIKKSNR